MPHHGRLRPPPELTGLLAQLQAVTKLDNSVANTEDTSLRVTVPNTVRYMTCKSELLVNVVESPAHIDKDVPADIRF